MADEISEGVKIDGVRQVESKWVFDRFGELFPLRMKDPESQEEERSCELSRKLYEFLYDKVLIPGLPVKRMKEDIGEIAKWMIQESKEGRVGKRKVKFGGQILVASYIVAAADAVLEDEELGDLRDQMVVLREEADQISNTLWDEDSFDQKIYNSLVKRLIVLRKEVSDRKGEVPGGGKIRGLELWGLTEDEIRRLYSTYEMIMNESCVNKDVSDTVMLPGGEVVDLVDHIDFVPENVLLVGGMVVVGRADSDRRYIQISPMAKVFLAGLSQDAVETFKYLYRDYFIHEIGHLDWNYVLTDEQKDQILQAAVLDEQTNDGYLPSFAYPERYLLKLLEEQQQQEIYTMSMEIYKSYGKLGQYKKFFRNTMRVLDEIHNPKIK